MFSIFKLNSKLYSIERQLRHQWIRYYRFGNRVKNKGFYKPMDFEYNQQFLRNDNKLSAEELRTKRNDLFDKEMRRQLDLVTRVEKIEVSVINPFGDDDSHVINLFMNRFMSTPYNCGQHIHRLITERSVVALIDDKTYWDINRPLVSDCFLRFKHFKDLNPYFVNKTFWRSCSLIMGSVIERAFKDDIHVNLHSWPKPDPNSGSFVYDVCIDLNNWRPNAEELRVFTAMLQKMSSEDIPFERLDVNKELAKEMFEHNDYKREQIDSMVSSGTTDSVTVYRIRDHIDLSCGPMIANTSQVGAIHMTAVYPMDTHLGTVYRFQGIAIPKQLNINSYTFGILRERALKLNSSKFFESKSRLNNESKVEMKSN